MKLLSVRAAALGLLVVCGLASPVSAGCQADSVIIPGARSEIEGNMSVNAGTGCSFNVNGIPGAISEVKIVQAPKFGRAGVQNLKPFYFAKPGYQGPDAFAYAILGTDQYGGPMSIVIKRKVTVVP